MFKTEAVLPRINYNVSRRNLNYIFFSFLSSSICPKDDDTVSKLPFALLVSRSFDEYFILVSDFLGLQDLQSQVWFVHLQDIPLEQLLEQCLLLLAQILCFEGIFSVRSERSQGVHYCSVASWTFVENTVHYLRGQKQPWSVNIRLIFFLLRSLGNSVLILVELLKVFFG